jgi:DNA-binding transcriptional ArsR family regulator
VAQRELRRTISDPRALTALAHPVRLALLNHLMAFGPRTASQCADVVDATPSNCSYHLRHLARFGLVEPVEAEDGRERPWRATATGFNFRRPEGSPSDPAAMAAEEALAATRIDENARLAYALLGKVDRLSPEWRDATALSNFALRLNPAELVELTDGLDRLIRPFIAVTRPDPPADAETVHLSLQAFVHPDTLR